MKRFELEWQMPQEPGLTTYVSLFDAERPPHYVVAVGRGGDESDTLLDLWTTLIDLDEPAEAIDYVAAAYTKRTSKAPVRPLR